MTIGLFGIAFVGLYFLVQIFSGRLPYAGWKVMVAWVTSLAGSASVVWGIAGGWLRGSAFEVILAIVLVNVALFLALATFHENEKGHS